jgi:hypothetical protein
VGKGCLFVFNTRVHNPHILPSGNLMFGIIIIIILIMIIVIMIIPEHRIIEFVYVLNELSTAP